MGALASVFKTKKHDPVTHDYTVHKWGHGFTVISLEKNGHVISGCGWGNGIRKKDYLILRGDEPNTTTRYRVQDINYYSDPPDMFKAILHFDPRTK